ncbi:MAG: hypothetical protein FD168_2402 [Desulfobulbaceae bacterium]|nr:MAG: hypothetical protein FD168_2402 [Desulfobulbaceae bacterium]
MIKKTLLQSLMLCCLATPITFCASPSEAGDVDINFHLGGYPRPPVIIAPQPRYRSPGPAFYFDTTPDFIYMNSLGFDVAMGSPYDLFRHSNSYYIFHQGYWHRSSRINGPWHMVDYRSLPPGFRRHKIEQIRRYRDVEYRKHRHDRRDDRRDYHDQRDYRNDRGDRYDRGHH